MKVLLVAEPLGPVGENGDGVDVVTRNLAAGLRAAGHHAELVAPRASLVPGVPVHEVDGVQQPSVLGLDRAAPILMPRHSLLVQQWERVYELAPAFDVILNLAYDWLPLWLAPAFPRPVASLLSLSSRLDVIDDVVVRATHLVPRSIAVHSRAQAETFSRPDALVVVGNGIDLKSYPFSTWRDAGALTWIGRVSPEKGLEDALKAAQVLGRTLRIYGAAQDPAYFARCKTRFPETMDYRGFVNPVVEAFAEAEVLLMTPHAIEAFGNVAMEALACGVPVVAYRRGGPQEIIDDGVTGVLVDPESGPHGVAAAVDRASRMRREDCRAAAEARFGLDAFVDRVVAWLKALQRSGPWTFSR